MDPIKPSGRFLPRSALLLAAGFAPAMFPLWLIHHFGTNSPYLDQWFPDMAGMYVKAHQHTLSFSDFTVQHNEHRILLPRVVLFTLDSLTHLNAIAEMYFGCLIVAVTSCGLLWLIHRTPTLNSIESQNGRPRRLDCGVILFWLLCNLALFTPAQAENWLWGLGLIIFMPALFLVSALIVVSAPKLSLRSKTLIAILLCSAATYSYGNGVISWPLVAMVLAWSQSRQELKRKSGALAAIAAAFAVNIGLYLINYSKPHHGQADPYSATLGGMIHFFFAFLGNPFAAIFKTSPASIATFCGIVSFTLLVAAIGYFLYLWRIRRDYSLSGQLLIWLAVAGYAVFSAAIAAATRSGFGLQQALSSRYVSFPIYLTIALIASAGIVLQDLRRRGYFSPRKGQVIAVILTVLFTIGQLSVLPGAIAFCKGWRHTREEDHGVVLLSLVLPENPQLNHAIPPDPPLSQAQASLLDQIGYLHPPLIRDPNAAHIETKSNFAAGALIKAWQPNPSEVMCTGYAILPSRGKAADTIFVTCDNQNSEPIIVTQAIMGADWPGVIPTFEDPDYRWAGWVATIPLNKIPASANSTRLTAWVLDSDTGQACRLEGAIDVSR